MTTNQFSQAEGLAVGQPSSQRVDRAGRYTELDGLRGIAVASVLVHHYTVAFDTFFPTHRGVGISFEWGKLGVQLFFMISGFVILMTAQRHERASDFALARAIRLYPTYWACLTLTVMAVYGAGVLVLGRPWWEIVVNYSMLQSFVAVRDFDGVYWSLAREIVFYLLIAAALLRWRRVPRRVVIWGSFAWSLAGLGLIGLHTVVDSGWSAILVSAAVAEFAPLFGLGAVLYLFTRERRLHPVAGALAALAAISTGLLRGWPTGVAVALIVLAFAAVVLRGDVPLLRWRVLTWLGAISYPLYLLHQNIGYVVLERTVDRVGPWPARVLATAVVLVIAWVVHELVEVRASRWLSRLLKRPRRAVLSSKSAP